MMLGEMQESGGLSLLKEGHEELTYDNKTWKYGKS